MLAGRRDALGLLAMAGVVAATNPWAAFAGEMLPLAAGVSAAAGGVLLSVPWLKKKLNNINSKARVGFVLRSDPTPEHARGKLGLHIGQTADKNESVDITNGVLQRHLAIIGQSGVGKTTLIESLLWQQTMRGGGWLFIDGKVDADTRNHVAYMAEAAGRQDELYVLDISNPENSNTMNPLLEGDPDEVASRLMNLIPSSENNPGADFYRQSANHALTVIIGALQAANKLYHFGDLSILLQSGAAMETLERMTPEGGAKRALAIFLDQFRKRGKDGDTMIDTDRLKTVLGGMSGRIALFAQGKFGEVFNVYAPEIVLKDIVVQGKMLYVSLPTMGKDTAALNLGKMIILDLRSAVAVVQTLPSHERPKIPFVAVLDEMGSYVMKGVSTLFEQARSAGIAMVPAFQSFSQLNEVSEDFADIVIQNTWTKVCFKFGAVQSSEMACELLGKSVKYIKSLSVSDSQGTGAATLRTTPDASNTRTGGYGESWRESEDYRVTPDQIRSLGMGETFVLTGSSFYHLMTPMLFFPDMEDYTVMRYRTFLAKGKEPLRFEDNLDKFLTA